MTMLGEQITGRGEKVEKNESWVEIKDVVAVVVGVGVRGEVVVSCGSITTSPHLHDSAGEQDRDNYW